jgi:hypothetical protein
VVTLMILRRRLGGGLIRDESEWYLFHPSAMEFIVETDKVERSGSDEAEWCKIHPSTPKAMVKYDWVMQNTPPSDLAKCKLAPYSSSIYYWLSNDPLCITI